MSWKMLRVSKAVSLQVFHVKKNLPANNLRPLVLILLYQAFTTMFTTTTTQLKPKVVVALLMSRGIASDGQHTNYTTVGDGDMYVFQDGTLTQGVWHKTDRKAQFTFTDKTTGKPIAFNPGQTWVSIVDPGKVTYK